jgi:hypothetical protein
VDCNPISLLGLVVGWNSHIGTRHSHTQHRFHKGGHCGNVDTLASHRNFHLDQNNPPTDKVNSQKPQKKFSLRIPISSNQSQSRSISPDKPVATLIRRKTVAEEEALLAHQQAHAAAIQEGIAGGKPFRSELLWLQVISGDSKILRAARTLSFDQSHLTHYQTQHQRIRDHERHQQIPHDHNGYGKRQNGGEICYVGNGIIKNRTGAI